MEYLLVGGSPKTWYKFYTQKIWFDDFAYKYNIPFFKDTTPGWSVRGKLRNKVLPTLQDTYTSLDNNLLHIADQSNQLNYIFINYVIQPFMKNKVKRTDTNVIISIADYEDAPLIFWRHVLSLLFNEKGIRTPSMKNMEQFMLHLKSKKRLMCCKNVSIDFCLENISVNFLSWEE